MAKMVDYTCNKIANFDDFCRLNSLVYRELTSDTTVHSNFLRYLLIIFVIRKNNGFIEFHNLGEEFLMEFKAGDIVVTYSFLGYLPFTYANSYTTYNKIITNNTTYTTHPQKLKISQELCELLEHTKYMGENMLFNEKVFLTLKRTTEKEAYLAFEQHLATSCGLRMKKSEIFTFFKHEKIPKMLNF